LLYFVPVLFEKWCVFSYLEYILYPTLATDFLISSGVGGHASIKFQILSIEA
jgi:hypothetical protein